MDVSDNSFGNFAPRNTGDDGIYWWQHIHDILHWSPVTGRNLFGPPGALIQVATLSHKLLAFPIVGKLLVSKGRPPVLSR